MYIISDTPFPIHRPYRLLGKEYTINNTEISDGSNNKAQVSYIVYYWTAYILESFHLPHCPSSVKLINHALYSQSLKNSDGAEDIHLFMLPNMSGDTSAHCVSALALPSKAVPDLEHNRLTGMDSILGSTAEMDLQNYPFKTGKGGIQFSSISSCTCKNDVTYITKIFVT
jgi:hypothetical protein